MTSTVIGDFGMRWPQIVPSIPYPMQPTPWTIPPVFSPAISREEFDALKREVEALRGLLEAAKKFDAETGQPDCEQAEKVALLKRIAELVGVDISDVLGQPPEGDGT